MCCASCFRTGGKGAAGSRSKQGPMKQNASPGEQSEAPRRRWKPGRSSTQYPRTRTVSTCWINPGGLSLMLLILMGTVACLKMPLITWWSSAYDCKGTARICSALIGFLAWRCWADSTSWELLVHLEYRWRGMVIYIYIHSGRKFLPTNSYGILPTDFKTFRLIFCNLPMPIPIRNYFELNSCTDTNTHPPSGSCPYKSTDL